MKNEKPKLDVIERLRNAKEFLAQAEANNFHNVSTPIHAAAAYFKIYPLPSWVNQDVHVLLAKLHTQDKWLSDMLRQQCSLLDSLVQLLDHESEVATEDMWVHIAAYIQDNGNVLSGNEGSYSSLDEIARKIEDMNDPSINIIHREDVGMSQFDLNNIVSTAIKVDIR